MELLLVRHARPVRHDAVEGRADPGLSEDGRRQAWRLAQWLAAEPIDALYTSPACRAQETARPLAERLAIEPTTDDGLSEFDREATSYVPIEELAATDERWLALARGEFYEDVDPVVFRKRVVEAVEAIIDRHPGQVVVAVCHGGVVNAYVGHILGIPTPLWFAPAYTGISRVAASRRGARAIVALNETGHLRDPA
jgi:2,3-bisphosphoglycerate-dependent phosphoglycerate mutase